MYFESDKTLINRKNIMSKFLIAFLKWTLDLIESI